jgi:uncharacterized protein
MLALVLMVLFGSRAPALADPPIPALTGRIVDNAEILDRTTRDRLTQRLADYEQSTGTQIVVVTLSGLQGYSIEDWGLALGRGWAIGQKGRNNGVILLVAPKDRALRIEVGYGLEGVLTDATADAIIRDEIVPFFRRGDMAGGVTAGVHGILAALSGGYRPAPIQSASPAVRAVQGIPIVIVVAFVAAFIIIVLLMVLISRQNRGGQNRGGGYYDDGGPGWRRSRWDRDNGFGYGLSSGRSWDSSSSGSSFGGFSWGGGSSSSGSSSGGGFSGGGGGSFGGGGASGKW